MNVNEDGGDRWWVGPHGQEWSTADSLESNPIKAPATGIALSGAPRPDNAPGGGPLLSGKGGSPGRPFNTMKRRQALVIIQTASKYSRYYYSSTSDPKVSNFAKSACF